MKNVAIAACFALALAACPDTASADPVTVQRCKSYVQGRIDVLDAELHKGNKPNEARRLIKRRDKLRNQLADCQRNPMAYKKDV
jgi:hypothetical protein